MIGVCKGCGSLLKQTGKAGRPFEFCPKCTDARIRRNHQRRRFVKGLGYDSIAELADAVQARPDVVQLLQGEQ